MPRELKLLTHQAEIVAYLWLNKLQEIILIPFIILNIIQSQRFIVYSKTSLGIW